MGIWEVVLRSLIDDIEALQKPKAIVSGTSDIPWHRDCDGGLHPYLCYSLNHRYPGDGGRSRVGADGCDPGVAPGAGTQRPYLPNLGGAEPVFLTTATGDITIHGLFHTALPPTEYERKVIYAAYARPKEAGLRSLLDDLAARRQDVGATAVMS